MLTRQTIGAIARTGLCALALAALLPHAFGPINLRRG